MDKNKFQSLLIQNTTSIKKAMQKLQDTAEKVLFVVDVENNLIGTVTDGNIRRGILNNIKLNSMVQDVMYKNFRFVQDGVIDVKKQAQEMMMKYKIEHVPVLDQSKKIVDVISWTDILEEKNHPESHKSYENQVVIMAGGKGTRMDPFTRILPKPLIPIGEKPVVEIIMEKFFHYGFHKFTYTLNYKKEYLKLFLKENNFSYEVDWVEEKEYLGTAGSLLLLKDKLDKSFFVANCDSLLDLDFSEVLSWHKEHKASMTVIGCHNEIKIPFGVLDLSNGKLNKISEKPTHDVIINTGVYLIEPHVLSYIPEGKQMDMNTLIDMVSQKEKVTVFPIYSGWFDIGQMDEYKKCIEHFDLKGKI